MLEYLIHLDTSCFYIINNARCPFLDCVLPIFSSHLFISLVVAGLTLYVIKQGGWKRWYLYLALIGLCFLFADRISVLCFKDVFQRLRPSHALADVYTLKFSHFHYITTNKGGLYGFVSSHAANTFAVATLVAMLSKGRKGYGGMLAFLTCWVVLTGYSRVYCGYHYPGDVICGALLGILIGYLLYLLHNYLIKRYERH